MSIYSSIYFMNNSSQCPSTALARDNMIPIKTHFKKITPAILFSIVIAGNGCGGYKNMQSKESSLDRLKPIVEKRETISATGYAVIDIQRHDNPAQRRLLAIRASKLDAYRNLVEQVYGQYLDSNTTIADMVVKSDTFRSKVEGVIYGARLVSITPVGEDTYEVTLTLDKRTVQDLRVLYLESARLPAADA